MGSTSFGLARNIDQSSYELQSNTMTIAMLIQVLGIIWTSISMIVVMIVIEIQ